MSNAKHSFGTVLKQGVTTIGELTEIGGVDISADTIDVTTLASADGYREFIQGLRDGGEISMSGFFYPGDAGQSALLTSLNAGTADSYTIEFPATMGATWTVVGIMTAYNTGSSLGDAVTFEATLKVTGKPSLGVTVSAGLSALVFSGAGTLTPAFANGKYVYTYTHNAATITVTPTAASHTIKLYIDGVYIENVTTATASSAIAFAAAESKLVQLVANEVGATPLTYTIAVART